ncbi:MAG: YHS domain-containing protein, partial [Sphingobacteriaceae bacterium]|nr:YHS domain-containing protein [Sphingobacteriaceae bacterium]
KTMKKLILFSYSLFLFLSVSNAFANISEPLKKDGIDPICQMKVKAGNTNTFYFNKVNYGFCSDNCKKRFAAEPRKYIKK